MAHSQLISSDPAADSSLDRSPPVVSLTFDEDVEPRFATVTLAVGAGTPAQVPASVQGSQVLADVPPDLAAATTAGQATGWQLAYRVVSGDGHPITGTLDFTVTAPPPPTTSGAPASSEPQPSPTASGRAPEPASTAGIVAADARATGGVSIGQLLAIAAVALAALVGAGFWLSRRRPGQPS
ncbi:copper resistance CopC family protein [Thalassiella azotivora]